MGNEQDSLLDSTIENPQGQSSETKVLEDLLEAFKKIAKNDKALDFKDRIRDLKTQFFEIYDQRLSQKKQEFLDGGGNEIEFFYELPVKAQFESLYNIYRDRLKKHNQEVEQTLLSNLEKRLEIIEGIKGLINTAENLNNTFKTFKDLQLQWKAIGKVPRQKDTDTWRTYQHHVEMFYDFVELNRDLRDMDFKHNLEERRRLIDQANALVELPDVFDAFGKLQTLHKIWKEEVGPVSKEFRASTWEEFSQATKKIHERRQLELQGLEETYANNLKQKEETILAIRELISSPIKSHKELSDKTQRCNELCAFFLAVGNIPKEKSKLIWDSYKSAIRDFNSVKNTFYKSRKSEVQEASSRKKELLALAESLKDSDNWEETSSILKKARKDWTESGYLPAKYRSLYEAFNSACKHFFKRYQEKKSEQKSLKALENKTADYYKKELTYLNKKINEVTAEIRKLETNVSFVSGSGKENPLLKHVFEAIDKHKEELKMLEIKKIELKKEAKAAETQGAAKSADRPDEVL